MSKTILIVEDQEDNRRILRDLLQSAGFEILEATSGLDGVVLAIDRQPDLILMDMQLPGIDGYEATRRLRASSAFDHTPIVAVTSFALSGDDTKAFAAGCNVYITKPYSPRALLAKVCELLDQSAAE
jgi:two-component system cell cycle response regulator DivK